MVNKFFKSCDSWMHLTVFKSVHFTPSRYSVTRKIFFGGIFITCSDSCICIINKLSRTLCIDKYSHMKHCFFYKTRERMYNGIKISSKEACKFITKLFLFSIQHNLGMLLSCMQGFNINK